MAGAFSFSFGPWNLHSGQDPFGPEVRDEFTLTANTNIGQGVFFR